MTNNLICFEKSGKTKDLILSVLSEKKEITGKEIHNLLKRNFQKEISFQAIFKELKKMQKEGILTKQDRKYFINQTWVEKIVQFGKKLKAKGDTKEKFLSDLETKGIHKRHFDSVMEMGRFVINELMSLPSNEQETICFLYHIWPTYGFSEIEIKNLEKIITEKKFRMYALHKTPVDIIQKNFYEGLGAKVFLGKPMSFEVDIVIVGEYVAYFHFDPKKKKLWDTICQLNKKFKRINLAELLKPLSNFEYPVEVIIIKDKAVADNLRKYSKLIK